MFNRAKIIFKRKKRSNLNQVISSCVSFNCVPVVCFQPVHPPVICTPLNAVPLQTHFQRAPLLPSKNQIIVSPPPPNQEMIHSSPPPPSLNEKELEGFKEALKETLTPSSAQSRPSVQKPSMRERFRDFITAKTEQLKQDADNAPETIRSILRDEWAPPRLEVPPDCKIDSSTWPYKKNYRWQNLYGPHYLPTLFSGSEANTTPLYIAERPQLLDSRSEVGILGVMAILSFQDESQLPQLINQLGYTLGNIRDQFLSDQDLPKLCLRIISRPSKLDSTSTIKEMAKTSLTKRRQHIKDTVMMNEQLSDGKWFLRTLWSSVKKKSKSTLELPEELLNSHIMLRRALWDYLPIKTENALNEAHHEIIRYLQPIYSTYRCRLYQAFYVKNSMLTMRDKFPPFEKGDKQKIDLLKNIAQDIFDNLSKSIFGVQFKSPASLKIIRFFLQKSYKLDFEEQLLQWFNSNDQFLRRATDMDIYEWIIKSLAEIGDDESLNLLYSIYCHFENAFLVVHDSLTHYKIFGDQRSPDDHTKCILQLHKPSQKGEVTRAIHFLTPAEGERISSPKEFNLNHLKEIYGLELKSDEIVLPIWKFIL